MPTSKENLFLKQECKVGRRFDTVKKTLNQNKIEEQENLSKTTTDVCFGYLDIMPDGYGFLRKNIFGVSEEDIYVSPFIIKLNRLRVGDFIEGVKKCKTGSEKYDALLNVLTINNEDIGKVKKRIPFEYLIPLFPKEQIKTATSPTIFSTRIIDLIAPIGKGQRGLIVAQPKSGKTMLLKDIASGISTNHKEIKLMVLLIGERPEEVTEMQRLIEGEVIASTFDETEERQVKTSVFALEKAKRLVEKGEDVVILMDSITRLARAYNVITPASGKILSGGIELNSLYFPKKIFGAARNTEYPKFYSENNNQNYKSQDFGKNINIESDDFVNKKEENVADFAGCKSGSLTIIATALVDTGSKMDDVIFEEFKGTGNMELQLDRNLANRRIFPAIDIFRSGTRRDDLLLNSETLIRSQILRRFLAEEAANPVSAMEILLKKMKMTLTNEEFLMSMNS